MQWAAARSQICTRTTKNIKCLNTDAKHSVCYGVVTACRFKILTFFEALSNNDNYFKLANC